MSATTSHAPCRRQESLNWRARRWPKVSENSDSGSPAARMMPERLLVLRQHSDCRIWQAPTHLAWPDNGIAFRRSSVCPGPMTDQCGGEACVWAAFVRHRIMFPSDAQRLDRAAAGTGPPNAGSRTTLRPNPCSFSSRSGPAVQSTTSVERWPMGWIMHSRNSGTSAGYWRYQFPRYPIRLPLARCAISCRSKMFDPVCIAVLSWTRTV